MNWLAFFKMLVRGGPDRTPKQVQPPHTAPTPQKKFNPEELQHKAPAPPKMYPRGYSAAPLKMYPRGSTYSAADKRRIFGNPGPSMHKNLVTVEVPYPLRLYKSDGQIVRRVTCHKKVAKSFLAVMQETLDYYGLERIHELGLDIYHGAYAERKARGSKSWSSHAYGIAFDFDANHNGLHTSWGNARFHGVAYIPWMRIWEKYGFMNLGRVTGFERDAMHHEASNLPGNTWDE